MISNRATHHIFAHQNEIVTNSGESLKYDLSFVAASVAFFPILEILANLDSVRIYVELSEVS